MLRIESLTETGLVLEPRAQRTGTALIGKEDSEPIFAMSPPQASNARESERFGATPNPQ